MCKAYDLVQEINNKIKELQKYCEEQTENVQIYTSLRQKLLHDLENMEDKMDLYTGWKITKKIKDISNKRREAKDSIKIYEKIKDSLKPIEINDKLEKYLKSDEKTFKREVQFDLAKEDVIYNSVSKIPRIKGTSAKVRYRTEAEKTHMINNISKRYNSVELHSQDGYIKLIERK